MTTIIIVIVAILIVLIGLILSSNFAVNSFMESFDENEENIVDSLTTVSQFARAVNKNEFNSSLSVGLSDTNKYDNYYVTSKRLIALSPQIIDSASISALSVASHELGHAMQERDKDKKFVRCLKLRRAIKLIGISIMPLFLFGIIAIFTLGVILGLSFVGASFLVYIFCIIVKISTLEIEKDASKRGLELLKKYGKLNKDELEKASDILKKAYMTYYSDIIKSAFSWTGLTSKTSLY